MDSFDQLIRSLCQTQNKFIPKPSKPIHEPTPTPVPTPKPPSIQTPPKPPSTQTPPKPPQTIKPTPARQEPICLIPSSLCRKISTDERTKLDIIRQGRNCSFYTSLLYLLSQNYQLSLTYDQKLTLIDELQRLLISRLDLDLRINKSILELGLRVNQLIDEIKNDKYQSPNVIFYVSLVFDLNIIVIAVEDQVKFYYSDPNYDKCKPTVLIHRDDQGTYHPMTYQSQSLINYHEHPVVKQLVDQYLR